MNTESQREQGVSRNRTKVWTGATGAVPRGVVRVGLQGKAAQGLPGHVNESKMRL